MDSGFGLAHVRAEGIENNDPTRRYGILGIVPPDNTSGIQPTEFKVLIEPKAVEDKIGSIIVPDSKKDADKYATIEGRIVALSHLAFTYATEAEWDGKKPKPGDRVLFAKYAGVRHKGKDGTEYVLANDKDVVAILED